MQTYLLHVQVIHQELFFFLLIDEYYQFLNIIPIHSYIIVMKSVHVDPAGQIVSDTISNNLECQHYVN